MTVVLVPDGAAVTVAMVGFVATPAADNWTLAAATATAPPCGWASHFERRDFTSAAPEKKVNIVIILNNPQYTTILVMTAIFDLLQIPV